MTDREPGGSDRLWAGLVAAATALLTLPVLRLGFVHDDRSLIEHSPRVGDLATLPRALVSDLFWLSDSVRPSPYWRPWVTFTYYLDHLVGGGGPGVYHLHNGLLAVVLALVVWWAAGKRWQGAVVAGLVVLHPSFVEPVANITARTDLYVALLGTAAVVLPRRWGLVALGLALGCKETAILVPALWALQGLGRGWRSAWAESRWGWLVVGVWLVVRSLLVGGRSAGAPWEGWGGIPGRLGMALQRMVAPSGGPRPDVDLAGVPDVGMWVGGLLVVVVAGAFVALAWRRRDQVAVALAMVLGPLLLTSGLAGPGIRMADGLLAWPLVGVGLVLARLPGRGLGFLVPVVAVLAWGHSQRLAVWSSPETLWHAALVERPDDPRVQLKLGRVVLEGAPRKALLLAGPVQAHADARLRREGHELAARALLLEREPGEDDLLREHLRAAAVADDREAGWAYGALCVWDDQHPGRVAVCETAIALGGATGDVWNTLGIAVAGQGDMGAARDAFAAAVALEPGRQEFKDNLARAEVLMGGG